jgi:hypothetical protein
LEILLAAALIVAALVFLPKLLSSPETRLLRRVWSSERLGGSYAAEKKAEAIGLLLERFKVDFSGPPAELDEAIGDLLAAAAAFDVKYRNNLGVEVTSVLARALLQRIPAGEHPDLSRKLAQAQHLVVNAK